jgi:hypothetical protein
LFFRGIFITNPFFPRNRNVAGNATKIRGEIWVVIYCVIIFIVLIITLALYQATYLQSLSEDYILTSDGKITFSEDNMSLVIDNRHDDSSRIIEIDGVDDISTARIYSSALRTSSGDTIIPKITVQKLNSESSGSFRFVPEKELTQPASYDGWLFIRGMAQEHTVPINLSSPPMLPQALIIVLIGSVSSIAFWEVIHYLNEKNIEKKNDEIKQKADDIFEHKAPAEGDRMKKFNMYIRATSLKLQTDATRSKEKSRYETRAGSAKMTFTAVGSSAFGIIVALLGLLNNEYLMGITFLNYQDIGVLFGLGFGATSLKELFVKS